MKRFIILLISVFSLIEVSAVPPKVFISTTSDLLTETAYSALEKNITFSEFKPEGIVIDCSPGIAPQNIITLSTQPYHIIISGLSFLQSTVTSSFLVRNIVVIILLFIISMGVLAYSLLKTMQARRLSQRSENRFRALLDASPAATMIFQNFKLRFANASLEALTGYNKNELLKMELWQLIHPESLRELHKQTSHFKEKGFNFRAEYQIITKTHVRKWIDFSMRTIEFDNQTSMLATAIDITEKKNYEKQIIEAEERYALIVLATNDGISDYNITSGNLYLSPQWKEMLGYHEYEIENTIDNWIDLVHIRDRDQVKKFLDEVQRGHLPSYTTEYRMICKDKSCKWVSASFSVVFDTSNSPIRILGTHSDITQRKNAEEELLESEFRYKSLFFKNSAIMFITDPESGNIQDVNQAAADYYGYEREQLLQMNVSDIAVDKSEPENDTSSKTFKHSRHRLADGSVRDVEIYSSEIEVKAGMMTYSIIFDITERIKIEKELQKAKETAEEALRTKSFFISNVSHEIRTPLNAIIGLTDLIIQDENLSLTQLDNLKSIKYSSDHLLGIINDVLDFSKLEAGRVQLEKTDFDINKLVIESAQTINFKAKEKGIAVYISIEPQIPKVLRGDPSRLRQILLNLLSNAIKFTHEGKIDIKVKLISDHENRASLNFSVSDTGIGIPESKLENIFESFTQADSDTSRKFGGTGLGLSICKKLVELQDGTMGVFSKEGHGSSFWFELAYDISFKSMLPDTRHVSGALKNLRGIKILLVEDDSMNQFVMTQIMKKWHTTIDIVDNGLLAIKQLEQQKYHLVLMDLHMPELNGYETTNIIRNPLSNVLDHEVPIIALTADVSHETREKVKSAGMNDFLTKPSNQDDMYEKIMQAVIKSKSRFIEKKNLIAEEPQKDEKANEEITKNRVKKALADIFDEDLEGTLGLINRFLKDIPKTIVGINEAFYDNNLSTLNTLVHSIKPGFSYMGFKEISRKIDHIQQIINKGIINKELEKLCMELDDESRHVLKILRQIRSDLLKNSSVNLPPRT